MIDIDKEIDRLYKNPYENEGRAVKSCWICEQGIYDGDAYYLLDRKAYCAKCVEDRKVLGE